MKTARWLAGNGIDPKFFNQVAQFAHFGMMFTVTTVIINVASKLDHPGLGVIIGAGVCTIYASWHEFYWDPRNENAVTRGSDVEDFLFLMMGSAVAIAVFLLGR